MASSMSSINILKNSGEITDPCGTPAGQELFVERAPGSFTCCVKHKNMRGFSPGTPVLLSPQKPTLRNSNLIQNALTNVCTNRCSVGKQIPIPKLSLSCPESEMSPLAPAFAQVVMALSLQARASFLLSSFLLFACPTRSGVGSMASAISSSITSFSVGGSGLMPLAHSSLYFLSPACRISSLPTNKEE